MGWASSILHSSELGLHLRRLSEPDTVMVVVKLEMWPQGDEKKAFLLGRTYIGNIGGTDTLGDYAVAVCRKGSIEVPNTLWPGGPAPTRTGLVTGYPRLAYNVWRLVARALLAAFPEEKDNAK